MHDEGKMNTYKDILQTVGTVDPDRGTILHKMKGGSFDKNR